MNIVFWASRRVKFGSTIQDTKEILDYVHNDV